MKFNITKKFAGCMLGLAALGFSTNANAQTIMWGAGSTDMMEDSIGRFASTDATLAGSGWTTVGVTNPAAVWTLSPDGVSQGAYAPTWVNSQGVGEWITSPSIADGCGFFDSDLYFGDGAGIIPTQTPMNASMVSPQIDLSGFEDSVLAVKFYVSYLEFDITDLTVGVSIDGGTTWTDVDYRATTGGSGVRAWYNGWATVTMPGILDGATNLTDCRVRFIHNGFLYFTAIDDVSLIVGPDYDLAMAQSLELYDNRTIGYPMPYSRMDVDQVDGQTIIAGAVVANNGGKTLPASSNSRVEYNIEMDMNGTWTSVYTNSWALGADLAAGGVNDSITEDLSAVLNTVLNVEGYYRVTYNVAHDLMDFDYSNDSASVEFWITDNVISTAPPSATIDGPDANDFAFPGAGAGNVIQEFEWGNLYFFPAGATASEYLDSVHYRMYASNTFNSAVTEVETTVNVYQWVDGNGDGQVSFEDELQIVTLSRDTIPVGANDNGTHLASSVKIADPNTLNPNTNAFDLALPLADGELYCVTIAQTNSDGIIDINDNRNGFFASTYAATYEWNQEYAVEAFTPLRIVEGPAGGAGTESWFSGFSGPAQNPSIELRISDTDGSFINVQEVESFNGNVNVYPNPASTVVTVQSDFDQMQENVTYIVTDVTGRVVYMENRANVQNDVLTLDVEKFAAGVYFVNVKTTEGTSTQRFVKE